MEEIIYQACLKAAIDISGMDAGGVYWIDQDTGAVDMQYHRGLSPSFVQAVSHYEPETMQAKLVREAGEALKGRPPNEEALRAAAEAARNAAAAGISRDSGMIQVRLTRNADCTTSRQEPSVRCSSTRPPLAGSSITNRSARGPMRPAPWSWWPRTFWR